MYFQYLPLPLFSDNRNFFIFFKKYYFHIFNEFQKILEFQFGDPTIQTKMTTEHN